MWFKNIQKTGVPIMVQWKRIWLGTMRLRVQSLASLSGLRIWHCHELWCRSQTRFTSGIVVVVVQAGSCSLDWTTSLGTSICRRSGPRNGIKTKKRKKKVDKCMADYYHFLLFGVYLNVFIVKKKTCLKNASKPFSSPTPFFLFGCTLGLQNFPDQD